MSDVASSGETDRRKVFVIHGRNEPARKALFELLRALGLDPIEWTEAIRLTGKGSPYIGEVLDAAFGAAQAVVVLQTPDDVAHLHESLTYPGDPECDPQMQPRPNVLFEAGMAMGRNEERTIIVEMGAVKSFSDIHGRHVIRLDNSVRRRQELATRLATAGCAVRMDRIDWHDAGDLTPPAPPGGGLPLGRRLPSSRASGVPHLSARFVDKGRDKLGDVVVTNHGPGDVYELGARLSDDNPDGFVVHEATSLPIPRLPEGKSVAVLRLLGLGGGLSDKDASYFNLDLEAKSADGTSIGKTEFVSKGV